MGFQSFGTALCRGAAADQVIPHAFGERAVLKVRYAALIRGSQTWKHIVISEFELKQIDELHARARG
jgi:hypothetical protein